MGKYVYKVAIELIKGSGNFHSCIMCVGEWNVIYSFRETSKPKPGGGPLFCFATLEDAKHYAQTIHYSDVDTYILKGYTEKVYNKIGVSYPTNFAYVERAIWNGTNHIIHSSDCIVKGVCWVNEFQTVEATKFVSRRRKL